jgi:hypothetical protein
MAYYVPKLAGCFGAGCTDLYPEAQQYLPGPGPSPFPSSPMPGIRVNVNVADQGQEMIPYEAPMPEKSGLPWWAWLAIGLLVMHVAKQN